MAAATILDIPNSKLLTCLYLPEQEALARAQGPVYHLIVEKKRTLLPQSFFDRADAFSVEKLWNAGADLLALVGRPDVVLAARGYDQKWMGAFEHNLRLLHGTWRGLQRSDNQASVVRRLEVALSEEAQGLVSSVMAKAQAGGLRGFFSSSSTERASFQGKLDALWEISDKAGVPELRRALLRCGVTEAVLTRIDKLAAQMHEDRIDQARQGAAATLGSPLLRALKALILGEISKVSAVAKAELPPAEAEPYQVGRLLEIAARPASARGEPRPPAPAPVVTPAPPGPTPAAGPQPSAPAPRADGGTPTPTLAAGTLLSVTPAGGGAPMPAVVQPDGTIALLPVAGPPPLVASPQPGAPRRPRGRGQPRSRRPRRS